MKKILWALAVLLLLSGCSVFGEEVPDGFSRKSYEDMVNAYRAYEKEKITNEKTGGDLDVLFGYQKLDDNGKLTETEHTVRDLISGLTVAYGFAYTGLTNESYDITELAPNTLTVEMAGMNLEEIRVAEERVLAYLELEPLPVNQEDGQLKRKAHSKSADHILRFVSVGNHATPAAYEDSYVIYRKDRDEYYIASAFSYNGKSYKYDMILDSEMNLLDAYMVDDIAGILSKPMNDDVRPKWAEELAANKTEEPATAPSVADENPEGSGTTGNNSEEEQSEILEDIYGDDKEVFMDVYGAHPDGYVDDGSGESESQIKERREEEAEQPDADLPEWDKRQFLGGTIADVSAALSDIRQLNAEAMSLDLDVENANEAIMNLVFLRDNLELMTKDPATSPHFSNAEKETINRILGKLSEAIEMENLMISDPSTQNIRMADSTIEDAMVEVDGAQFEY